MSCYKEKSTGKDQITVCGGGGRRRQGDQRSSSCAGEKVVSYAQIVTTGSGYGNTRKWGRKGIIREPEKRYFVLDIYMNPGGQLLPYLKG